VGDRLSYSSLVFFTPQRIEMSVQGEEERERDALSGTAAGGASGELTFPPPSLALALCRWGGIYGERVANPSASIGGGR